MNWNELVRPEVIWTLIGLGLLIAEFAVPGLVILFFGAGAILVGGICLLADLSLNEQLILFLVGSVGLLISLRNSLASALEGRYAGDESENSAEVVGERVRVVEAITPELLGRVELHGTAWRAESTERIPLGATVEIVGRDNLTLLVKRVDRA